MSDIRSTYPPFDQDDDWRSIEVVPPAMVQSRARELVIGVSAAHDERHGGHDHPWCTRCHIRHDVEERQSDGLNQLVSPQSLAQRLDDVGLTPDHPKILKAKQLWEAGYIWTRESLADPDGVGLDPSVVDAVHHYLDGLEDWEALELNSRRDPQARASRYLLLRHRQPDDPWPALPVPEDLDSAYLRRDQLGDLPSPEPLIERTLPRHAYGLLTGRDGTFKSFVALDWALSLASGRSWNGRQAEPVKVLYVAAEGAYGLARRLDAWEAHHDVRIDPESFVVRTSALSLFRPTEAFTHLLDYVAAGGFGLVVVDTLRRVSGAADGNSSEMGNVVDNLARIKDATTDGTVLAVAHTGKDDRDARGFSGIEDDADFVWHTSREDTIVTVECRKMKDAPDGHRVTLRATACEESLVLVEAGAEEVVAADSQVRILQTLRNTFPDGAHSGALMEATGLPKSTFHLARGELQKAGHIVNSGSKQRPFYEVVRSNEVQGPDIPSDLRESNGSNRGPVIGSWSPGGPAAFKGGPLDSTGTPNREVS